MRIRNLLLSVFCLPMFSPTHASQGDQTPMNSESVPGEYVPQKHAKPSLADLLTIESSASIFYTYARETELTSKFTDESSRLTVFVPTNTAVMALARKPHLGPDSGSQLSQEDFDKRTKRNVERWISAHIVPEYPLFFDSNPHETLLKGKSISFLKDSNGDPEWKHVVVDNHGKIIKKMEGSNGDLYIIDGVISVD